MLILIVMQVLSGPSKPALPYGLLAVPAFVILAWVAMIVGNVRIYDGDIDLRVQIQTTSNREINTVQFGLLASRKSLRSLSAQSFDDEFVRSLRAVELDEHRAFTVIVPCSEHVSFWGRTTARSQYQIIGIAILFQSGESHQEFFEIPDFKHSRELFVSIP